MAEENSGDVMVPQSHGGALRPFQPGQSGNPAGKKPGTIHLSTHIQNLLNDPEFEAWVQDPKTGIKQIKGAPMKAMITALAVRAANGDVKAFDVLAKHGYGQKIQLSNDPENPINTAKSMTDEELNERIRQIIGK